MTEQGHVLPAVVLRCNFRPNDDWRGDGPNVFHDDSYEFPESAWDQTRGDPEVERISAHYAAGGLGRAVLAALEAAGRDLDALIPDDLASLDAFHIRGRAATADLARRAELRRGFRVLDVGCGIGGTCRFLASVYGCHATGIDLNPGYVETARLLSERVGLETQTRFVHGSALKMPFADAAFDAAWTEHVQMNVPDKPGFYAETARVLRPGGALAFHDVFRSGRAEPYLPLPWAATHAISHLVDVAVVQTLLADAGFEPVWWEDVTDVSRVALRRVVAQERDEPSVLPVGSLWMGVDAGVKLANLLRNLEENRIRVVQAVLRREPPGPAATGTFYS